MKRLALALVCALTATAAADVKTAAAHYKQGKAFFDAKAYDQAIAEYQQAFAADGNVAHLYNIARAYQLAGDPKHAVEFYQRFLAAAPDSPTAPQARDYVAVATKDIADAEAKQREADEVARKAAAAQQQAAEQEQRRVAADAHVRQAEAFAHAGAWGDAGAEYAGATDADGDPAHLIAAAAAYRKQPDPVKARDAYRAYLTKVPMGSDSDLARTGVADLTKQIDKTEQDARDAKLRAAVVMPLPPEVVHHQPSHRGWIIVGSMLVLTGFLADVAPPASRNGQFDASDLIPPVLYGLGATSILVGVF